MKNNNKIITDNLTNNKSDEYIVDPAFKKMFRKECLAWHLDWFDYVIISLLSILIAVFIYYCHSHADELGINLIKQYSAAYIYDLFNINGSTEWMDGKLLFKSNLITNPVAVKSLQLFANTLIYAILLLAAIAIFSISYFTRRIMHYAIYLYLIAQIKRGKFNDR